MLRISIITVVFLLAALGGAAGIANAGLRVEHKPYNKMTRTQIVKVLKEQIRKDKSILRFWHNHPSLVRKSSSIARESHKQKRWVHVSLKIAANSLHKLITVSHHAVGGSDIKIWLCIHSYEGAWNDNTGNGYFGGLQMNIGFQQTYGSEFLAKYGTANNWPIIDQIIAARRARDGYGRYGPRGYTPWPRSSVFCGV